MFEEKKLLGPEDHAREKIDCLLHAAGWETQNPEDFNRNASLGVAVREFHLKSGPCDYLLVVSGKAAGVIEAKMRVSRSAELLSSRKKNGCIARPFGQMGQYPCLRLRKHK
ncbi:hypothetical protein [Leisingera aquimarina]|uniref:hypothetical protein n=1 Tax=Leisingera aquimarina TaxID=476529 RepID=UPI0012EC810F|nr:hypothetical protein [Leisingera aquimarina]